MNGFKGRSEAGRELAGRLAHLTGEDCVVLALPRGGLPVAFEVARALHAPLDVLNVRKLGVPSQPELAMGAVSTNNVRVLNDDVIRLCGVSREDIERATAEQRKEIERREQLYRGGRPAPRLDGRTVILVDDGIATGATVRAAIAVVRSQKPKKIVLGVPVAAASTVMALARDVDELASVIAPSELFAIGAWYDSFPQLTDADVQRVLAQSTGAAASAADVSRSPVTASTK